MNKQDDRIQCAIDHIKTAIDVDPWAKEIAVEAMEKQRAEKPHAYADGYADGFPVYDIFKCPACGRQIDDWEEEPHHCICGQALEWEE